MNIKKLFITTLTFVVPISSATTLVSCSSAIDQNYIDKIYADIVNQQKDWKGNGNVYASSIYDIKTFRSVFKDQLPSEEELLKRNFKLEIENTDSYDNLGIANFIVRLKDSKTNYYYQPTPTKLTDSDNKFPIIDFTICNFLRSTTEVNNNFDEAYRKVPSTPKLNSEGINIFNNQNIETYFSLNDKNATNWLGKTFDKFTIPGFEWSAFYDMNADNKNKIIIVKYYLKNNKGETKGPGKEIILKLK